MSKKYKTLMAINLNEKLKLLSENKDLQREVESLKLKLFKLTKKKGKK